MKKKYLNHSFHATILLRRDWETDGRMWLNIESTKGGVTRGTRMFYDSVDRELNCSGGRRHTSHLP